MVMDPAGAGLGAGMGAGMGAGADSMMGGGDLPDSATTTGPPVPEMELPRVGEADPVQRHRHSNWKT